MALMCVLVLMWILGHDFSAHYNWLALISVDIISGVYCIVAGFGTRQPQVSTTVSAAYTGELGTGRFLRYKRKYALYGEFYFKNRFWGFKNLRYKRKSG